MVEGGFLKGKNGLTLAEHGLVLKQSDRDVVIDKVLPNCKGDFESGDTILSLNGIVVSKAALVHKALEGSESANTLEVSRGSGRVQEVVTVDLPAPPERKAPKAEIAPATKAPELHTVRQHQPLPADNSSDSNKKSSEGDAGSSKEDAEEGAKPAVHLDAADVAKEAGNKAFKAGDMSAAVDHFTEAIRLRPSDFTFFSNRSAALLQLGRLEESAGDGRQCIALKPDLAKGHFRLSQAQIASGDLERGCESLRRACEIEPLNAQLRGALARAARELARKAEPRESPPAAVAPAAAASPKEKKVYGAGDKTANDVWASADAELAAKAFERAAAWAEGGENLRAAEGFTEAINLAPSNPGYYAARSAVLLKAYKFDDALEDADKALSLRPGYALGSVRKGQALAMLGRMDLAVDTLEAAVIEHPEDAQLKNALGDIRVIAGRMAGVMSGKSELMSTFEDEMVVNVEVPRQSRGGDTCSVTVNVPAYGQVKCNAKIPLDKKGGDSFLCSLGTREDIAERKKEEANNAYKSGRMQKAAEDYTVAIGLNPKNHAYYVNRSAANYTMGKFEEALADAEACLKLKPGFGRALFRKGQALAGMCEFERGVEALEEAMRAEGGGGSGVEEALGRAREDLGRQKEGKGTSREEKEGDRREGSEYVIHRAQLEVERRLAVQWQHEQVKKREVEKLRLEREAQNLTSGALEVEIAAAKWQDKSKADTERAKFQAVAQRVEYDQFEQMVAGASLNAMKTRSSSSQQAKAGIIISAGSDSAAEGGLSAKRVNQYGEGRKKLWLPGFEGQNEGTVQLHVQLTEVKGTGPPSTLKEFDVAWRKAKGSGSARYGIMRSIEAGSLSGVFRTEMDSDTLCEMLGCLAGPEGAAAGGEGALEHAIEFLAGLRALPRFELNARFLGSKDRANVAAVVKACEEAGLGASHGDAIREVKASFGA